MSIIPFRRKRADIMPRFAGELGGFARFRDEMSSLFERYLEPSWWREAAGQPLAAWTPTIDVSENEREITVRAELPGIDPKDIKLTVSGSMLTITGEKREERQEKSEDYYHCERRFGSFQRTIELPAGADLDKIEAEDKAGVLTVHIKKLPGAAPPRRIPVKEAKPKPAERAMAGAR